MIGQLDKAVEPVAANTAAGPVEAGNAPRRLVGFGLFLTVLSLIYFKPLKALVYFAMDTQLYSHVLLVPFICGYLINLHKHELPARFHGALAPGIGCLVFGACLAVAHWVAARMGLQLSVNDYVSWLIFSFLVCALGGAFLFFGAATLRQLAFPVVFAFFLAPLPDIWNHAWEKFLQYASAEAANLLLTVSGTPMYRQGLVFSLPRITLEVAEECSGTRSTFVLFLTSLLGGHLFLRTGWKKGLLALVVIPIGIARNAARIFTIAMLCVHVDPSMINSWIHRKGGPIFFMVSLTPLFLLLWWLRRSETRKTQPDTANKGP